ncbi:polysaccharide biosynthesis protein [Palleniella muris]|uniref:Polysaccharide biosynthesis protein n=1 Tax=Palleniella muris TaxID=3038145 RepID=A0AC61QQ31_9BACT|nr:glycosyltransferase [Palleniella muris]TGX82102.1 polysaccharide biosynthesis protein [Palleniella muris]
MIPKIIHYCWFGANPLPADLQEYVNGWKNMFPDYEIKCWDESTFDIANSLPFVREAYEVKKFAFVADYVRMWAMYHYGGIYMDTDIKVLKRFDDFMNYRFFTAVEYHEDNVRINHVEDMLTADGCKKNKNDIIIDICIESSIFAAEKGHPFIKDCLHYYTDKHFVLPDGSYYDKIIVPVIMGLEAEKYGFRYVNKFQVLKEDMHLFPDEYFTHPSKQTANTYALHMVKNSWKKMSTFQKIYASLAQNKVVKSIYDILEKMPFMQRLFDLIQKYTWLKK